MKEKKRYPFSQVKGDQLKTRIYTLDNGLRVYLTVFKDAPRIQSYIAVHTGSKMDPPETTGLAHYFEHMMFKGTEDFGTADWKKERPLIRRIESLFEAYRKETNQEKRAAIYREIDKLSYQASSFAIPNEYDKMMDAIGSQGSNAGTSNDYTIFMENIPSNQLENWAIIESNRFTKPVLRLFHTELETVYEEKNMSLTSDSRKISEAMMTALFPDHPYGTQTTLGEAVHLKNPSMKNIRAFFSRYYVPNNMAICLSGDLDPAKTMATIDKYFGSMKPRNVRPLEYPEWTPLKGPVTKRITGHESEQVKIGFGFDIKASQNDSFMLTMIGSILSNGKAGLIDLNLNQAQLVLNASAYTSQLADYGMIILSARPKTGQTLEQARNLLLGQVEELKQGNFPEWLPEAIVSNTRFALIKQYESNQGRATVLAQAFLNDISYKDCVDYIKKLGSIRRKDILDFANVNMGNNHVVIFKRQGNPADEMKIQKPPITPVQMNRESESVFLRNIRRQKTTELKPEFIDYGKDVKQYHLNGRIRVIYKENTENDTFSLVYRFKMGRNHDKLLNFAITYLPFLGTLQHPAEEIKKEFFRLACSFNADSTEEETLLSLTGLGEHFVQGLSLMEELMKDPLPDEKSLRDLTANTLKARNDGRSNQNEVFNALVSYGTFGARSPLTNILSEHELKELSPESLIKKIIDLRNIEHEILYYGPAKPDELLSVLAVRHQVPADLKPVPEPVSFTEKHTSVNIVLFAPYNARQARLETIIAGGKYDPVTVPYTALFNLYFGSTIVFQELREKRGLAYTAYSRIQEPADLLKSNLAIGYIATQSDKIMDAFGNFDALYNSIPRSDSLFNITKDALIKRICSERIRRMNVIWNFLNALKLGLDYDIRKNILRKVREMTLDDLIGASENFIRQKPKTYLVLGNEPDIDFRGLEKIGPVTKLTIDDLFGG